jgi:hypothetical protein
MMRRCYDRFNGLANCSNTDEPRRSVRATKGQHTKSLDLLDEPIAPKKKATKKTTKKTEEVDDAEEEEVIRCVCGVTVNVYDEEEPWIACDVCNEWQHNICVGVSRFGEDAPEHYRCEKHDPTFPPHKELLDGLKKGKKIWLERRAKVNQEIAEEKRTKKKGGKKGKAGKRASEGSELNQPTNGKAKSPLAPVPPAPEEKKPVARSGSTKRKSRDESQDKESVKVNNSASVLWDYVLTLRSRNRKPRSERCRLHQRPTTRNHHLLISLSRLMTWRKQGPGSQKGSSLSLYLV